MSNSSPDTNKQEVKGFQECLGVLLYFAMAIDDTILLQQNFLATQTNNCTKNTMK